MRQQRRSSQLRQTLFQTRVINASVIQQDPCSSFDELHTILGLTIENRSIALNYRLENPSSQDLASFLFCSQLSSSVSMDPADWAAEHLHVQDHPLQEWEDTRLFTTPHWDGKIDRIQGNKLFEALNEFLPLPLQWAFLDLEGRPPSSFASSWWWMKFLSFSKISFKHRMIFFHLQILLWVAVCSKERARRRSMLPSHPSIPDGCSGCDGAMPPHRKSRISLAVSPAPTGRTRFPQPSRGHR